MSRALNGTLATDITQETLTLCHCWVITLTNLTIYRLTDHDQNITFLGETFVSDSGFNLSMLESGENLSVDNAEMKVLLATNYVNKSDIINGYYDGATIQVYLVNWSNTSNYCALPGGFLTKINESDVGAAVFELVSLSAKLNQKTGTVLEPTCNADVGDSRCSVNLASFTTSGTVTGVTSRSVFTDTSNAEADDYFNYGKVTWTSGNNVGIVSEVKLFANGQFTLVTPTPAAITIGDGYDATRGCDRRLATCRDVFTNVVNFRGAPFGVKRLEALGGPK